MKEVFNFYNTNSRTIESFKPFDPEEVKIYTCGPTVYAAVHLGNYRTFIFEDILVRSLEQAGYGVRRVLNITDVGHLSSDEDAGEDKMQIGARKEGISAWEVAKKFMDQFLGEMPLLHLKRPTLIIRATDYIQEQIDLIKILQEKGYVYLISDGVYFDSSKVANYAHLARLDISGLRAGARVLLQKGKKNSTDFALWKFSPPHQKRDMEWESPWGKGFPGWHLECSAIALGELGSQIDIHCGGVDHIPVHHTNEIAQCEAATQKQFVKLWMHAQFLQIDGGRMSKSFDNYYTLSDLIKRNYDPLSFRFFCFSASYRAKLNFTWEGLDAAQTTLFRLRKLTANLINQTDQIVYLEEDLHKLGQCLANDLNMPEYLANLWDFLKSDVATARKIGFLKTAEEILNLNLFQTEKETKHLPILIEKMLQERKIARMKQKWPESDVLRAQIASLGYDIQDTEKGQHLTLNEKKDTLHIAVENTDIS